MRFRMGIAVGFAAGYYLGAKAGRERYEQMRRMIGHARDSRAFEKARAAVDLGLERIRPRETTIDITGVVVEELATR